MNSFRHRRELPGLITLASLLAGLAIFARPFFSVGNLRDLALANIPLLLVASAMTLIIVLAQIDVSVGSIFAIAAVAAGLAARSGWSLPAMMICAVLSGLALGLVNGALVAFMRIPSIVATLATMITLREMLRWFTGGAWIENLPASFQWFGQSQTTGELIIFGCGMGVFALLAWSAHNMAGFRAIYATGSDSEAATLAGINTRLVVCWTFGLMGALSGLAALLNAVRFSDVPANSGVGLELKAIAAVVVGGTPITGGRATLGGTLVGVCLLACIGPGLTFLGLSAYWEKAVQGTIILVTIFFESLSSLRHSNSARRAAA